MRTPHDGQNPRTIFDDHHEEREIRTDAEHREEEDRRDDERDTQESAEYTRVQAEGRA